MKTSFYFFLWFIVYWLIGLTGNRFLIQNDFLVALVFVYLIGRLDRRLFYKERRYQSQLNNSYIFEIFYTHDARRLCAIIRDRLVWQVVWATYCILTVLGLLALKSDSLVAYLVFGFIGIATMMASFKTYAYYRRIKENGMPEFSESEFARNAAAYEKYCELRSRFTASQLIPPIPTLSKWVNVVSILFALACIAGGGFYFFYFAFTGQRFDLFVSAILIWAVLAIYFGVKDLIDSIRLLGGKPISSLKTF